MDASNGVQMDKEDDMLRVDAMILTVQLNLRQLIEVHPFSCTRPMCLHLTTALPACFPMATIRGNLH